jgi:hypothetical protein
METHHDPVMPTQTNGNHIVVGPQGATIGVGETVQINDHYNV